MADGAAGDAPLAARVLPTAVVQHEKALNAVAGGARAAMAVSHPFLVTTRGFEVLDGYGLLLHDLYEGHDLSAALGKRGKLTPDEVRTVAQQVCPALAAVHGAGLFHGDVRPGALVYDTMDGRRVAKLTGPYVGIFVREMLAALGHKGPQLETLVYRAPELVEGGGRPSAATDQYALAATFYELLTANPLFSGMGAMLLGLITKAEPHPIEGVSDTINEALLRALSKKPEQRFPGVMEFLAALEGKAAVASPADAAAAEEARRAAIMAAIQNEVLADDGGGAAPVAEARPAAPAARPAAAAPAPAPAAAPAAPRPAIVPVAAPAGTPPPPSGDGLAGLPTIGGQPLPPPPTAPPPKPKDDDKISPIAMVAVLAVAMFLGFQGFKWMSGSGAGGGVSTTGSCVVNFATAPPGATVLLGDEADTELGVTPTVKTFEPGKLTFTFRLEGYADEIRRVTLPGTPYVTVTMARLPGTLQIRADPASTEVSLDGKPVPKEKWVGLSVPGGPHKLTGRAEGYEDGETTVEVVTGQTVTASLVLEKVRIQFNRGESLTNSVGMAMAWLPNGVFTMGSTDKEARRTKTEGPAHRVAFDAGFWMSATEVTQEQWSALMDGNPSQFKDPKLPVENVTWDEANEFCARLSKREGRKYRLPSEAEWEYACRAGTTGPFTTGDDITPDQANYAVRYPYDHKAKPGEPRKKTTPVGSFKANAFGLYDMHGNVAEWCLDVWKDDYEGADKNGAAWLAGKQTVRCVRGGSFESSASWSRSATRASADTGTKKATIGFRVVIPE